MKERVIGRSERYCDRGVRENGRAEGGPRTDAGHACCYCSRLASAH